MTQTLLFVIVPSICGLILGMLLARLLRPAPVRTERTMAEQVEFMRNLLAFLLVAAFVGAFPALMIKAIPKENEQLLTYMLGQLSGMATMALGFYFTNKAGQDAVDAKRADNTGKMADLTKLALETGTTDAAAAKADGAVEAVEAASVKAEELQAAAGTTPPVQKNEE